jgi:membrane protein involved in colicin uptake
MISIHNFFFLVFCLSFLDVIRKSQMAKFLSRLFSGGSSSKGSSLRGSQTSLHDDQNRGPRSTSTIRTSSSLENLGSYHVIPRELEKNKLHKASWEGNISKVERLARPGQINVRDQQMRVMKYSMLKFLLKLFL